MKVLFVLYFILTQSAFSLFMIEGPSMEPTLQDGEIIMIDKNAAENGDLERGDMVVFSLNEKPDFYYVKRIVGLPGEKLHIKNGHIYIESGDGLEVLLGESYLGGKVATAVTTESYRNDYEHTYVIPWAKYFVLGDNRGHSVDSRYFRDPFITKSNIKGEYLFNVTDL